MLTSQEKFADRFRPGGNGRYFAPTRLGSMNIEGLNKKEILLKRLMRIFDKKAKKSHVSLLQHDHHVDIEMRLSTVIRIFGHLAKTKKGQAFQVILAYCYANGGLRFYRNFDDINYSRNNNFGGIYDLGELEKRRLAAQERNRDLMDDGKVAVEHEFALRLHEGTEKIKALNLANGVDSCIEVFNRIELLCQAYMCIYHRVLKLKGVQFLGSRNTFKGICELYYSLLEKINSYKYGGIDRFITYRIEIYALLFEDLFGSFVARYRYYLMWSTFNTIKNYKIVRFYKFRRMNEILNRYVRRQTNDEYWRLKKRLQDMFPRESLFYLLAGIFKSRNDQNLYYSLSKITDQHKIRKILDRDIYRGGNSLENLRRKKLHEIFNLLVLQYGKPGHEAYRSTRLLPLRTQNLYLNKLRTYFSMINAEKIWYYQDLILAKKDEIRWYRREIKKRQYHRNLTKLVSMFKTIKNRRQGDGHRKMIIHMKKPQNFEKLAMLLNQHYLKKILDGFERIKRVGMMKKKKLDEEAQMNIREGLINLDLFARNRLSEAFSTVRTIVMMYEVLNIQEVTDEKELVSAYLNSSGGFNTSGAGRLNMSNRGSIVKANYNNGDLGINGNNKSQQNILQSQILDRSRKNSNHGPKTAAKNMRKSRIIGNNYDSNYDSGGQNRALDRTPNSSVADISIRNTSHVKRVNGPNGKTTTNVMKSVRRSSKLITNGVGGRRGSRRGSKFGLDQSRRFDSGAGLNKSRFGDNKDSLDFKFEDIRSLSPILKDSKGVKYFENSKVDSNIKQLAADISREMRTSGNYGGNMNLSPSNPYISGTTTSKAKKKVARGGNKGKRRHTFFSKSPGGLNLGGLEGGLEKPIINKKTRKSYNNREVEMIVSKGGKTIHHSKVVRNSNESSNQNDRNGFRGQSGMGVAMGGGMGVAMGGGMGGGMSGGMTRGMGGGGMSKGMSGGMGGGGMTGGMSGGMGGGMTGGMSGGMGGGMSGGMSGGMGGGMTGAMGGGMTGAMGGGMGRGSSGGMSRQVGMSMQGGIGGGGMSGQGGMSSGMGGGRVLGGSVGGNIAMNNRGGGGNSRTANTRSKVTTSTIIKNTSKSKKIDRKGKSKAGKSHISPSKTDFFSKTGSKASFGVAGGKRAGGGRRSMMVTGSSNFMNNLTAGGAGGNTAGGAGGNAAGGNHFKKKTSKYETQGAKRRSSMLQSKMTANFGSSNQAQASGGGAGGQGLSSYVSSSKKQSKTGGSTIKGGSSSRRRRVTMGPSALRLDGFGLEGFNQQAQGGESKGLLGESSGGIFKKFERFESMTGEDMMVKKKKSNDKRRASTFMGLDHLFNNHGDNK